MKIAFLYHPELKNYSFGEGHPFGGDRFEVFFDFFKERFAPFKERFCILKPEPVTDEILQLVHTQDYIKTIKAASCGAVLSDIYNYVSLDNVNPVTGYIPQKIDEASRMIVGGGLRAGELVLENKFKKAIAIGGMHHAKPSFGEGFCFYNDVAILVKYLKQKYNLQRILVLDTDAHAGNGTKEIFYEDPEVLFIDIHQDPRTLYPGTGFIEEIGRSKAEGFTVNLVLSPNTSNQAYQYLFEEVIFPLAREFQPQVIIRYGGSDPHYLDELTNLGLTLEGFKMIGRGVREISEQLCQGKAIDLLLSGYNLAVLPFAWSALISGSLGLDIDLSDFKEESPPPRDYGLNDTQDMVRQLKKHLKKYWRCMGE